MYYKIVNTECEVYKKLHQMRTDELRWEKENREAIEAKIGLKWGNYIGRQGQQNLNRVTEYFAFEFEQGQQIDPKIWVETKEHKGYYKPNLRSKIGREIEQMLLNGLQGHAYSVVYKILGLSRPGGRFTFPYIEIFGSTIALYLDDKTIITDENVIEITSKEFNELSSIKSN